MYFVYMIRCRSGRLYTGITTDTERRFREHSGGNRGAKFTHADPPEAVEAVWSCENRSLASRLEYRLKQLKRSKKLAIIEDNRIFEETFPESAEIYTRAVACEFAMKII